LQQKKVITNEDSCQRNNTKFYMTKLLTPSKREKALYPASPFIVSRQTCFHSKFIEIHLKFTSRKVAKMMPREKMVHTCDNRSCYPCLCHWLPEEMDITRISNWLDVSFYFLFNYLGIAQSNRSYMQRTPLHQSRI